MPDENPSELPDTLAEEGWTQMQRPQGERRRDGRSLSEPARRDTLERLKYEIRKQSMENELYRLRQEGRRLRNETRGADTVQQSGEMGSPFGPPEQDQQRDDNRETIIETYRLRDTTETETPADTSIREQEEGISPPDTPDQGDMPADEVLVTPEEIEEDKREQESKINKEERRLEELQEQPIPLFRRNLRPPLPGSIRKQRRMNRLAHQLVNRNLLPDQICNRKQKALQHNPPAPLQLPKGRSILCRRK